MMSTGPDSPYRQYGHATLDTRPAVLPFSPINSPHSMLRFGMHEIRSPCQHCIANTPAVAGTGERRKNSLERPLFRKEVQIRLQRHAPHDAIHLKFSIITPRLSKAMRSAGIHLYGDWYNYLRHPHKRLASYLPVSRHVISHCLVSTQLLRILFASPRTQHALEASFGAWHGVLPRNLLCYLGSHQQWRSTGWVIYSWSLDTQWGFGTYLP
jgi:hypothetical protein